MQAQVECRPTISSTSKNSPIHVLHVDDDSSILEISKQILMDMGNFKIDHALCVDEAFKKLATGQYDVVVSDYEMPQKNGLEFLKELRAQNNTIPFILFTGKGREDVAAKALNLDADRYLNKNGSPETVYCELTDAINKTAERKKSGKALAEAELNYRTVVEKSLQGILITQTSPLRLVFANESMGKILGYSTEELKSLSPEGVSGLIYIEDRNVFFKRLESRMRGEPAPSSLEFRAVRKNRSIVWLEAFATPIEYRGQPAVQGMFLDIDERKKAEEVVRKNEVRYRELANSLPEIIFETDLSGKITFFNQQAFEVAGFTREELEKGANMLQFVIPQEREKAKENIKKALSGQERDDHEYTLYKKNNATYPAMVKTAPIVSENKIVGLRGIVIDITERKRAEQELKESEEKYKTLFEQAGDYTLILEAQSTGVPIIFDANISALQIHGYTREEIIGKPITFLDAESSIDSVLSRSTKLLNNEKLTFETKHRCKDGSTIDVEVSIKKVKVGSKNLLVSVERDITERKKMDEALRRERDMLEALTKNIGAGLVMISKDYKILWMNNYLKQLTGASEGNPCYSSFNTCNTICPDCGPKKIFEGALIDRREYCNQTEYNKDHPVWFELIATPIKDENGNVVAALELTVNITEKKEAEEKQNESNDKIKMMNEKLRVVGSLTRHDVGNKLMTAKSNMYLLRKRIGDNPDLVKYLDSIDSVLVSSDRIFDFSRAYEKIGAETPSKQNVYDCFNQAVVLFQNLGSVKVVNECQGLEVVADSLLKQLFYNFIDNSLKHGEKVNQVHLRYAKDCNGLKLLYEDNGVGVPEANKSKLFEAGFTTGNGAGLGLYLVKKMMDVYGWTISEEGEQGKGAKFVMTIPKLNKNGKENYQIAK